MILRAGVRGPLTHILKAGLIAVLGCGSGCWDRSLAGAPPDDLAVPPPFQSDYVLNRIVLSTGYLQYSGDLNGDLKLDNGFGVFIGLLETQQFDIVTPVDSVVGNGEAVTLFRIGTSDPAMQDDSNARTTIFSGLPQAPPDFSGQGRFTVDREIAPTATMGVLEAGRYRSEAAASTKNPVSMMLPLAFDFFGVVSVRLKLNGVQVLYHKGIDAKSGAPGLIEGRIAGSVQHADFLATILPPMAAAANQWVQMDPNPPERRRRIETFDVGDCANASARDGRLEPCELETNRLIGPALKPDVQIYDANGRYAPNKANTMKDSVSVGVAFTAVRASF